MAEFVKPKVSTLKVLANLDPDDVLVQDDTLRAKKTRTLTIKGFKIDGTLDEANIVFDKVLHNVARTTYDSISATKTVTESLTDKIYVDVEFISADIEPSFTGKYQLQGTLFTATDFNPIFTGAYQLQGNLFTAEDFT